MTNPNETYKAAVLALQERLGRPPTTKDAEFMRLGEELRQAWIAYGKAEETVLPPRKGSRAFGHPTRYPERETDNARNDARKAGRVAGDASRDADRALVGPGGGENPGVAATDQAAVQAPVSSSHPLMVGGRGPNGGRYAVCSACRRVWERPATRGRPCRTCEECRG